tara:strand:+ start:141 stop:389 length:249 start_codon:yes stop_codon:yes gene_type:complete
MNKIEKLTKKDLIRRLHLIKEDIQNLESALNLHSVDIYKEDDKGCGICTYLTNIEVCVGVDDNGIPTDSEGHRVETEWKLKK